MQSLGLEDGSAAYQAANRAFLDRAGELAGPGERIVVLAIAAEGTGEMVQDLIEAGELRGAPALRIDPDVVIADRPRAFVAMPYGSKHDPQRNITVDCDLVYQRILLPALEHAQLYYRRADEEIDAGVVMQPMLAWLADADLVIADLQTGNFNVGWELGARHLLRDRQTLLIRPKGTVAAVRRQLPAPHRLRAGRRRRQRRRGAGGVGRAAAVPARGRGPATAIPIRRSAR